MIRFEHLDNAGACGTTRIWLQPNRSMTWPQNRCLLCGYLALGFVAGGAFVWAGYWPIAICILLTAALLIVATYATLQRLSWQECITLTPERILIQRGRRSAELERSCARHGMHLQLLRSDSPWQAPTLLLGSGDSAWETGRDLNASERRRLAQLLHAPSDRDLPLPRSG